MIETLILGFVAGFIATGIGAAYAAYKYSKQPYVIKMLSDGYEVIAIDRKFDGGKHHYIAIRKNDDIIFAVKLDKDRINEVCYDL